MKLGVTGLPGAGKTTIFEALTLNFGDISQKQENRVGTVMVPDSRVDVLSDMYKPQKTIHAQVEYYLPAAHGKDKDKKKDQTIFTSIRDCDALLHVVRNFSGYGLDPQSPAEDIRTFDQELIVSDFVVVEKKLERLELDRKRGKKIDAEESALLEECLKHLENETPLRNFPEIAAAPQLRGYAFLSAKPMLIVFNNEDQDETLPALPEETPSDRVMIMRGKLEHELAQMDKEEADIFLSEFNIAESAKERVINRSYDLLGLISFFTVGEDEVRAWTIRKGTEALDAAGEIHSDIRKGFIRAEVVAYTDLMDAGNYAEARKKGTVRLEGKTYPVQDGDIINFRFNV